MKKLMLIAALMLVSIGVSAQEEQFAVGGNIGVGVYRNSYTRTDEPCSKLLIPFSKSGSLFSYFLSSNSGIHPSV